MGIFVLKHYKPFIETIMNLLRFSLLTENTYAKRMFFFKVNYAFVAQ